MAVKGIDSLWTIRITKSAIDKIQMITHKECSSDAAVAICKSKIIFMNRNTKNQNAKTDQGIA